MSSSFCDLHWTATGFLLKVSEASVNSGLHQIHRLKALPSQGFPEAHKQCRIALCTLDHEGEGINASAGGTVCGRRV